MSLTKLGIAKRSERSAVILRRQPPAQRSDSDEGKDLHRPDAVVILRRQPKDLHHPDRGPSFGTTAIPRCARNDTDQ